MKALVLTEPNRIGLSEVPDPVLGEGDMMIRVRASAICGTDVRIYRGTKTRGVRFPSILGHEFSGTIVDQGGRSGWRNGQRVAVCPALPCGECEACNYGADNICEHLVAFGYGLDGGFAEYLRLPSDFVEAGHVIPLPDAIDFEEAALAEPLACVINGQNVMGLKAGERIAVLGAGPIGLLQVMLARARGAARITVVQRSGARREAALALGADEAVAPEDAGELHVDAAIVAVGSPELANLAARIVRPRGRINLFAGFPAGALQNFDLNAVHYKEQHVTGAFGLTLAQFHDALELICTRQVKAGDLITYRFPLADGMDAFAAAERGAALKAMIVNAT